MRLNIHIGYRPGIFAVIGERLYVLKLNKHSLFSERNGNCRLTRAFAGLRFVIRDINPPADHPRPTTTVVDHEGGESERQAEAAYLPAPCEPSMQMKQAARDLSRTHNPPLLPVGKELWASADIYKVMLSTAPQPAPPVASDKARISELEAEVERLKDENARYEKNARTDAKLMAGYHQICTEKGFAPGSRELLAAAARSTDMKGGER